ncbi:hypothetical protein D0N36_06810 [Hymenobacter lapidiphilus]|uniref:hypothetical protein n=1 Tax=Hymenobacter sp. CCM 8763 TaxID=2303334 RepID=UPI000E356B3C|nr:hypothetical protein [Hymenobacter sp. CCM 8763]RFP65908.1 hypothetical protein D0N36_06810 [Hymenobacter sp. CCM 8763]
MMEQNLFAGMESAARRSHLEAEAYKVVEGEPYDRPLEDGELDERKNALLTTLEKMDSLGDEKKEVMAEFKYRLDAFKKALGTLKLELRTGHTRSVGTLYYIPDYDARRMGLYTDEGTLISSRGLLPEERQQNVFMRRSAGE